MHDLKGEHKQSRQQFAGGFVVQRRKGNEHNQYSDRENQAIYNMNYQGGGNAKNRKSKQIMNDHMSADDFSQFLLSVYVDVIIDRWEKLTGEKAVLLNSTADE